jgi:hypothetical protein
VDVRQTWNSGKTHPYHDRGFSAGCNLREEKLKVPLIALSITSLASSVCFAQQFILDDRTQGSWVKVQAGHVIELKPNGDVFISFRDNYRSFSGPATLERCSDGGGNMCISSQTLGRCSYRYVLRADGVMNLAITAGASTCNELSGDYARQAP